MPAYERDRAVRRSTAAPRSPLSAAGPLPPILALQRAAGNAAVTRTIEVQRERDEEAHEHGAGCGHDQPPVQRAALEAAIRMPGVPVDPAIRAKADLAAGRPLPEVVVHRDAQAQRLTRDFGAVALTTGRHVFVGEGGGNEHTMLHELGHVLDQERGPVPGTDNGGGVSVSSEGDSGEVSADAFAQRAGSIAVPARDAEPDAERDAGAAPGGGAAVQRMPIGRGRQRRRPEDEEMEMRRTRVDNAIGASGGARLPRDRSNDSHLAALWDEAADTLQSVPMVEAHNGQPAQAHRGEDGYHISFDPGYVDNPYNGDTVSPPHFATASLLHEAHHVAGDRKYRRPSDPDGALHFSNFHLPTEGGVDGEALMASMRRQVGHADQNMEHARTLVAGDRGLNDQMREHLVNRLDYGQGSGPAVHYDTVLADMLQYMFSMGAKDTETYRYLRKLSVEAYHRRNSPGSEHAELGDMRGDD